MTTPNDTLGGSSAPGVPHVSLTPMATPIWLTAALTAMAFVGAPADGRLAEVEACLQTCDAQDDATDRATCRLQCEESVHAKDEPNIIRWRRTERIGGSFDTEERRRQETTTITSTTPRGPTTTTSTTTTTGPTPPPPPAPPAPAMSRYEVLANCQAQCDPLQADPARAACKLRCLRPSTAARTPKQTP